MRPSPSSSHAVLHARAAPTPPDSRATAFSRGSRGTSATAAEQRASVAALMNPSPSEYRIFGFAPRCTAPSAPSSAAVPPRPVVARVVPPQDLAAQVPTGPQASENTWQRRVDDLLADDDDYAEEWLHASSATPAPSMPPPPPQLLGGPQLRAGARAGGGGGGAAGAKPGAMTAAQKEEVQRWRVERIEEAAGVEKKLRVRHANRLASHFITPCADLVGTRPSLLTTPC